jgi:hypothetical protein
LVGAAVLRDYRAEDFEAVRAIHESTGIDYAFPDLEDSRFFVRKVLEVDGVVVAAGVLRVSAEAYLWLRRDDWGDKDEKLLAIEALQRAGFEEARQKGILEVVCWVPKWIERFFGKHLKALGWSRDREDWVTWSRDTDGLSGGTQK